MKDSLSSQKNFETSKEDTDTILEKPSVKLTQILHKIPKIFREQKENISPLSLGEILDILKEPQNIPDHLAESFFICLLSLLGHPLLGFLLQQGILEHLELERENSFFAKFFQDMSFEAFQKYMEKIREKRFPHSVLTWEIENSPPHFSLFFHILKEFFQKTLDKKQEDIFVCCIIIEKNEFEIRMKKG
jgi:hypothetical protein